MKAHNKQIKDRKVAGFFENIVKNFGTIILGTVLFALLFLGYFLINDKVIERAINYAAVTQFTIRYKAGADDKVSLDEIKEMAKSNEVKELIFTNISTDEPYKDFIDKAQFDYSDNIFTISYFDKDETYSTSVVKAIYTALSVRLMEEYDISNTPFVDEVNPVSFKVQVKSGGFVDRLGGGGFTMLGAVIGAVFSLVAISAFYLLDNTVKNAMDVRKYYDLPVLAVIPTVKDKED